MSLPPGTRIAQYEILDRLGAGGMGEVYRVRDARLGREAALKFLHSERADDPSALERFTREAHTVSALNHPNIITIHEFGESDEGRFIVMELVRGRPLRQVTAAGPMTRDALLHVGRQIAEALAVAHAAGIVHRDIKPDNILIRDDGYIKVLDFGIARLLPQPNRPDVETLTEVTGGGVLLGSVRYMSPEQARGQTVTPATDMFSLGIVLFELATGFHPFDAESPVGVLSAILTRPVVPASRLNPEVPAGLSALLDRMLTKDARLRPSAAECAAELELLAGGRPTLQIAPRPARPIRRTVGRTAERTELAKAFEQVANGSGLLVAISGEPGIGKTTLVEDFLGDLIASEQPCWIGRGRCSDRLAGTGAYLPLLEALDTLLHAEGGDAAAATMKLLAPAWYVQLVRLSGDDPSVERLRAEVQAGSQERLKRELAAFLRDLSSRTPVVFLIDDIHWADLSTVDVLTYIAGLFDSMRVLILATLRPSDLHLNKHPFGAIKLDLQARSLCREMGLGFLTAADVDRYLALEFPEHRFPPELSTLIHAKTEGNALFMAELARYLRDRGVVRNDATGWVLVQAIPEFERDLPESIRGMIQRKLDALSDTDRRLLLAGSVQGYEFDSAIVAKTLEVDPALVEERLEEVERLLAIVRGVGDQDLPDGTPNLRYRFVHILFQHALYNSLRATRLTTFSGAVARAMEGSYTARPEIASQLGLLFESARESSNAAKYFLVAAQHAASVFGSAEAVALAERALQALRRLPAGPERDRRELMTLLTLSTPLIAMKGYASPDVERVCQRAWELCQGLGETSLLVRVLVGLWRVHISRGTLRRARELAETLLPSADAADDFILAHNGHIALGITFVCRGELAQGREHLEKALSLLPAEFPRSRAIELGQDTVSSSKLWLSLALTFLAQQSAATEFEQEALAWARELSHPFSLAYASQMLARQRHLQRDVAGVRAFAEATVAIAEQRSFSQMLVVGRMYQAWALAQQNPASEHVAALADNLAQYRKTGAGLQVPHYLTMLADCLAMTGELDRAMEVLDEALELARTHEAYLYEAEVIRLRAALLTSRDPEAAAFTFRAAAQSARATGARLLELRCAIGLSRLLANEERYQEAVQELSPFSDITARDVPQIDFEQLTVSGHVRA